MKQIIVMIAMILLGVSIAGLIGDFGKSADNLSENAIKRIEQVTSSGAL